MRKRLAWTELVLAVLAGVTGVVTVIYPTWFEALFEASPDEGSGTLERAIAIALIIASVVLSFLAGRSFRLLKPANP